MLTKAESDKIISVLQEAFDKKLSPVQIALYQSNLSDLEYSKLRQVVLNLIQTEEFLPKIATIRREYAALGGQSLNELEAYALIRKTLATYGIYRTQEALEAIKAADANLYEIVKTLGWREICMCPENLFQAKFQKIWEWKKKTNTAGLQQKLLQAKAEITKSGLKLLMGGEEA